MSRFLTTVTPRMAAMASPRPAVLFGAMRRAGYSSATSFDAREHALESQWVQQHEREQFAAFRRNYLAKKASSPASQAPSSAAAGEKSEKAVHQEYMRHRDEIGLPKLQVVQNGDKISITPLNSPSDAFTQRGQAQEGKWIQDHERDTLKSKH
ncbi:hypothetical protein CXG81DRAFT_19412 [Caulochytrium protostelioides]|uniref:Uncharacterized protein n=1 Tax=Caulochytrium protostelioides TaxID=1555241 RepID=A0A4P9X679_9FUNG|nr:hypothetical protein CXG81DRAFT_19412 [Caulochytrium protostelioides]|eukprot:RKP00686.1 hypothetical protein CXG81DRAFT_19412 [Caulochytrium protostelioides]